MTAASISPSALRPAAGSAVSLTISSPARSRQNTNGDEGCDETRRRADAKRPARAEDEGAGDPDPIVEASQRPEDADKESLHGCSGWLPPWKRPNSRAHISAIRNVPSPSAM